MQSEQHTQPGQPVGPPPIDAPPIEVQPADGPPIDAPPIDVQPTAAPPIDVQRTDVQPTVAQPFGGLPLPPPSPPKKPRSRLVSGLIILMVLLPVASLCGFLAPMVLQSGPRAVPSDVCSLIPDDLLSKLVPTAKQTDVSASNDQQFTNRASCTEQTDADKATTTADASLLIQLQRDGSVANRGPSAAARDDFVGAKSYAVSDTIQKKKVYDIKLGDAAFLTVDQRDQYDNDQSQSTVNVQVLKGDIILSVNYIASPTTDERTAAAAITVADAILGGLR